MKNSFYKILTVLFLLYSCNYQKQEKDQYTVSEVLTQETVKPAADSNIVRVPKPAELGPSATINTNEVTPIEVLAYARTLIGIPYLFASIDPAKGFDCSGFITHVFNHFNVKVPRSSVEFTNVGKEMELNDAEPGDLILFTGTDSTLRIVGHMGIVENIRNDSLFFIHSSSGKANGVVITPLSRYYLGRFVKVVRIFPDRYFVNID